MNCEKIEDLLADYIGDELSLADRDRFETHLNTCEQCRAEVESLRDTTHLLHGAPEITTAQALERTSQLTVHRRANLSRRLFMSGLRYAAMLAVGTGIGWQLKPISSESVSTGALEPVAQQIAAPSIHPDWIKAATHAPRRHLNQSSFVRHLVVLSEVRRGNL